MLDYTENQYNDNCLHILLPLLHADGDDRKKKYHLVNKDQNARLAKYYRIEGYPNLLSSLQKLGAD